MKKIALIIFAGFAFAQCAYAIDADIVSELGVLYSLNGQADAAADPTLPSVGASNIRTGEIVHTGFLYGTATPSTITESAVASVEVAFDGGAYTAATGTTNWSIALPAGANGWRTGSQHTIQIRATAQDGKISAVAELTVRKGSNRDINGDGYQDMVIAATGVSTNTGRAHIWYGSASGLSSQSSGSADVLILGETTNNGFGIASTLADFNGDGYADLLVGASSYNSNQGRAYIFHSSGTAGITAPDATSADTTLTGTGTSQFGIRVAAGDVNGDGFPDALVAQSGLNNDAGNVYSFHAAGSSGVPTGGTGSAAADMSSPDGNLGISISVGDINGDGFADVLIGQSLETAAVNGRAFVFLSTGTGGLPTTTIAGADAILTGEASGNEFGDDVLLADLNSDGFSDVVVGAALAAVEGRAYIFQSAGPAGVSTSGALSATAILTGETGVLNAAAFGRTLAAGDVNGDGFLDLQVSATELDGALNDTGGSHIFLSTGSGGITTANASAAATKLNVSIGNGGGGFNLMLMDLNADGYADVFLSEGASRDVFYFQSAGIAGIASQDMSGGGTADALITAGISSNFGVNMMR